MFKSVMEVIFPNFTNNYRKGQKHKYLKRFKEQGFYLIDAADTPINDRNQRKRNKIIRENLKSKIKEIEGLISRDTSIILIKKNVFEIFYPELKKRGFNVAHSKYVPIPKLRAPTRIQRKI